MYATIHQAAQTKKAINLIKEELEGVKWLIAMYGIHAGARFHHRIILRFQQTLLLKITAFRRHLLQALDLPLT